MRRLAQVSHDTYIRQRVRDKGEPRVKVEAEVGTDPTPHDRERAEDIVAELERLGALKPLLP